MQTERKHSFKKKGLSLVLAFILLAANIPLSVMNVSAAAPVAIDPGISPSVVLADPVVMSPSDNPFEPKLGYNTAFQQFVDGSIPANKFAENRQASSLPSSYRWDSTPVENQGSDGTCWIFASTAATEAAIIRKFSDKTNTNTDLSEYHAKLSTLNRYLDGSRNPYGCAETSGDGGNFQMYMTYLTGGNGPVEENGAFAVSGYPAYGPSNKTSTNALMNPEEVEVGGDYQVLATDWVYSSNSASLSSAQKAELILSVKEAVYKYGALVTSINVPSGSSCPTYLCNSESTLTGYYGRIPGTNHAVTIVGWDDNISKSLFSPVVPSANGAFIIKNSWDSFTNDNGFIYLSYEDYYAGSYTAAVSDIKLANKEESIYAHDNPNDLSGSDEFNAYYRSTSYYPNTWNYGASWYQNSGREQIDTISFLNYSVGNQFSLYMLQSDTLHSESERTAFLDESFDSRIELVSGTANTTGIYTVDLSENVDAQISDTTKEFYIFLAIKNTSVGTPFYQTVPDNEVGTSFSNVNRRWEDVETDHGVGDLKLQVRTMPLAPSLSLDNDTVSVSVGETVTVNAVCTAEVSFSIEDSAVASISENGNSVTITGVSKGNTVLTASAGESTAYCTVFVEPDAIPVTGVSLDITEATLRTGETVTLTPTVLPGIADNRSVSWSSSDTAVATVEGGVVTAGSDGTAVITVSTDDGGYTATCAITVSNVIHVTGVDVLPNENVKLQIGDTYQASCTVYPADATDKTVIWTSDDPSTATVEDGFITGISRGICTITATSVDGSLSDSIFVNVDPFEYSAPILSAQPYTYNSIKLSWTPGDGADGYLILRSTTDDFDITSDITISDSGITSYIDKSLKTNKTYYYVIVSYITDAFGRIEDWSYLSDIVCAKPLPVLYNAAAARSAYNKIKLTWSKSSGASGYQIYRSTSENGTYSKIATLSSSKTSYTNSSLTCGRTYYYKIRAYKTISGKKVYGPFASTVSAKPYMSTPTVTLSNSYYRIKVSWGSVSGATGYIVYRSDSEDGNYTAIKKLSSTKTKYYYDPYVVTGKTYYYKVAAYRSSTSVQSLSAAKARTAALSTPSITAAGYSYTSNKISWAAVSGASGYEVYKSSTIDGAYSKLATITGGSTVSYIDKGCTFGEYSYYKVRAYRSYNGETGYSAYSSVKSARPALTKPGVSLAKVASKIIRVTWSQVEGADGYQIYRSSKKSSGYVLKATVTDPTVTTFTNSGLTKGKTYYFKVMAYKDLGGVRYYSPLSTYKSKRA